MDKKYIGKAVSLPRETHEALVVAQQELAAKLGFTPSLSETVMYLVKNRGTNDAEN